MLKKVKVEKEISDREYWTQMAYKIAAPVLSNMSKGELKKNMQVEISPTWDGRSKDVTYMECFGRLMSGIAPGFLCRTMIRKKVKCVSNCGNGL